jgi:hypothetical protein
MRKLVVALVFVLGVVALAATFGLASDAGATPSEPQQAAAAATARYHSVEQALKDGYSGAGEACVEVPGLGAMGYHYVNGPLIADGVIDPQRPEILLYVPDENGKLKLVGVEYFAVDEDQNLATSGDRPSLFGQPFDGPMPGHSPTMPIHYDLHVWLWETNAGGLFAPFNAALSC